MNQDLAEAISLTLTLPTIVLAGSVCLYWGPATLQALQNDEKDAHDWLIMGIFLGFLGALLDNSYWGIAWSSSFIDTKYTGSLFERGVYFNIPFRQTAGIIAAYCHLKSWTIHKKGHLPLRGLLIWSFVLGMIYTAFLFSI